MLLAVPHAAAQLDAASAASDRAAGQAESPPLPPDADEVMRGLSAAGRYVVVPVFGRIGVDVVPEGFEAIAARRSFLRGATAFVVEIDSQLGANAAAKRIAEALLEIGREVPVILVVHRAVGAAALLLPAGERIFITEPSAEGAVIAFMPEIDPLGDVSVDDGIDAFRKTLGALVERSPRRDALAPLVESFVQWNVPASRAYALGIAEPLEGGLFALGRTLRMEPWVASGRQAEDLVRRGTVYAQQMEAYRSRLVTRAFAALEAAAAAAAQVAAAEQAAVSVDPRHRPGEGGGLRMQLRGDRWGPTPDSEAAWQRSCEAAIAAWERVAGLAATARQQLRIAEGAIAVLVAGAAEHPVDGVTAEAIDRLERERRDVSARVGALKERAETARKEAAAVASLLGR